MFGFLAIVVAVIALVIAQRALSKVERLHEELLRARLYEPATRAPQAEPEAQAPPPVQPQAEVPPSVQQPPPQPVMPVFEPPPPPPRPIVTPVAPQVPKRSFDWENLIGIRLFSWIAGIALVLAVVFLFKYSVEHGWLRPAIRAGFGLVTGIALLIVCELRVARGYKFTANALDGAGIAILYATLFALHVRWHLWPAAASFGGMLLVTAAAVFLSTRRDSVFIALLGLIGGFATPALLSSGENRPIELFSYLLLLNGGISWIAFRKRWPLLTGLSVALTAIYQWGWISRFLTTGQLPLAAGIFAVFALVAAMSLWPRGDGDERTAVFHRIAAAGAVLPLLFAFFTAVVPEYGARYHVLFGFLLLIVSGLAAIAIWRGPQWLHALGALAALLTWFVWLSVSYVHAAWPWSPVWLAAFVALYLIGPRNAIIAAGLLFYVFAGLALREPTHQATLIGAMFALLLAVGVVAWRRANANLPTVAVALSSLALMLCSDASVWLVLAGQAALLAATLFIDWVTGRRALAVGAVFFVALAIVAAPTILPDQTLAFAGVLCALLIAWPLILGERVQSSLAPQFAACLACLVFGVAAYQPLETLGYDDVIGLLPLSLAAVLVVLLWRDLRLSPRVVSRVALVAGSALAFITAAVPLQLENEWITIAWALEGAALAWLYLRVPHRGLLVASAMLFVAVFVRLIFNPSVFDYHPKSATAIVNWYLYTYLVAAASMFFAARLFPRAVEAARGALAGGGTLLLFALLNIEIADWYSVGDTLTFNFLSSSLAQDLTYTFAWALFAIGMLVAGITLRLRGARVAALGLLLVTVLKCFLHDLGRLGGLYRVASLFGLAVSLVLVGVLLQRFVISRETSDAPTGTT
ncbi:MAG TPA: DUF2339 domain-containing protein [Thermoanaerobaculia bacterium]